jgi:Flp pilus assembly protein TadD
VYALGCILFELLAGEPPYTGETPQTIITRALTEPLPILRARSDVPRAVHDVIAKAMAATPADRYAGAQEFAGAMDLAVVAGPEHTPRTGHLVLAPRPLLAGLIIGVLIGVGALFAWRKSQSGAATPEQRYITSGEGDLTWILLSLRRYREAAQVADRALAFVPTDLRVVAERAMIALAQGDLAGARAVIRRVPKEVDTAKLVAFFAAHWDLYWALDETQQAAVFQLTPAAWDGNRGLWAYTLAETNWLRGDLEGTLAYAESARIALLPQIETARQDPRLHVLNGVALAYLGRKAEAIREGEQAVSLVPISNDARSGTSIRYGLARIYTLAGEPEKAIGQLESLLEIPFYLSPGWLKIDPNFDALRSYPRFRRLVSGS